MVDGATGGPTTVTRPLEQQSPPGRLQQADRLPTGLDALTSRAPLQNAPTPKTRPGGGDLRHVADPNRPTKLDLGLLTTASMSERMGGDFNQHWFGRTGRSDLFKAVKAEVAWLESAVKGLDRIVAEPGSAEGQMIDTALSRIEEKASAYLARKDRHPDQPTENGKIRAMRDLRDMAAQVRDNLAVIDASPGAPENGQERLSVAISATTLLRVPVTERVAKDLGTFNDANCVATEARFGSGVVNSVDKKTYLVGGRPMDMVFKKEMPVSRERLPGPGSAVGISNLDPRLCARNVAAAIIGEAVAPAITPRTAFARSGDDIGLVMELAPGKPPQIKREAAITTDGDRFSAEQMLQMYRDVKAGKMSAEDFENMKPIGWEVRGADGSERAVKMENIGIRLNLADPVLQMGLVEMEWLDFGTGEPDRNPGNYLVSHDPVTGKVDRVTVIDNDFGFGPDMQKPDDLFRDGSPLKGHKRETFEIGYPKLATTGVERGYRQLAANWNATREKLLDCGISKKEVAATKSRIDEAVAHLDRLKVLGRIIDPANWSAWTDPADGRTALDILTEGPDKANGNDGSYLGYLKNFMEHKAAEGQLREIAAFQGEPPPPPPRQRSESLPNIRV